MGVWQHEGGWLEQVLLSSQTVDAESSCDCTPQLMLVHYNSQYYLQSATGPNILQLRNSLSKVSKVREDSCSGGLDQMREVKSNQVNVISIIPLFIQQLAESQHSIYTMAVDEESWLDSNSDLGSGIETQKFALMPYYNDDVFLHMCTAGPNGLAVYFYLSPHYLETEECTSAEENKSSDERDTCHPPQNFLLSSPKRHWLISSGIGFLKYMLFGLFVLGLNKLRRYHQRRKRISNSDSTSMENASEVCGLVLANGYLVIL